MTPAVRRLIARVMGVRFEDYHVQRHYSEGSGQHMASIEEMFALTGAGTSPEGAMHHLEENFYKRVVATWLRGESVARPGAGRAPPRFAPHDQIDALQPLVDDFWSHVLGYGGKFKFVSNESKLTDWDHYVDGGREEVIRRTTERYGVEIAAVYDRGIAEVLGKIRDETRFTTRSSDST